jgi:hypothetical protein
MITYPYSSGRSIFPKTGGSNASPSDYDKTVEIIDAINLIIAGGGGIGLGSATTLNLSDTTIYDVTIKRLSVPLIKQVFGIFTLFADLYSLIQTYSINEIVKSDGTSGGVAGKFYKSVVGANTGQLLSDNTKWMFADAAALSPGVGNIEIESFGSPITLQTNHNSQFETEPDTAITFIPTAVGGITDGQIMLPINTPITIQGRSTINDIIAFNVPVNILNGIARYAGSSIN